jgi:AraC-like DNA-binding protein
MAIYDATQPYTLLNAGGIHQHFFRIRRTDLSMPSAALSEVTALRLSAEDDPLAGIVSAHLSALASAPRLGDARVEAGLGQPAIELVRVLIASHLSDPKLVREPMESTLAVRVMDYVRMHLADSDLSASSVAAFHNVSVRTLYSALARAGTTLGGWVREQRLEEARRDLAKPGAQLSTIAAIGRRWGFNDPTAFSHSFKTAYGLSPREWRELRHTAPSPS